jgi:hypothetical protein
MLKPAPDQDSRGVQDRVPSPASRRIASSHRRPSSVDVRTSTTSHLSPDTRDSNRVDALATVASTDDDECLYGGSSTIAFVRRVTQGADRHNQLACDSGLAGRQHLETPARLPARPPLPEPVRERDETAAVYPHRRSADDFIHCYWEIIHPVFPVIHKTSFMLRYEQLWSPQESGEPNDANAEVEEAVFSSTLNLMFALGCHFSRLVPAAKRSSVAEEFYRRSREIFVFDVLDSMSISQVQMLLLTGIYLQSTRYPYRCWNVVGLAIRVAQSLGLHSDSATRRPENQLTREMRRRLWHNCVILDRYVAFWRNGQVSMGKQPWLMIEIQASGHDVWSANHDLQIMGCPSPSHD